MALLDVFLYVLFEELLPHVVQWKDKRKKIFQVIFLNKGNSEWDSTYLTLFKIMDSFNKSRCEVYLQKPNYETNCKRRFSSNIQKFKARGELICHPEEKDGDKRVHVLEINLSDEEIRQRKDNLSEHEKLKIRRIVTEDELNKTKGRKRNSSDHSPSASRSSSKKFKSSALIKDLPCTPDNSPSTSSSEVLPNQVTTSSVEHNQSSTVINCCIYNLSIPVEVLNLLKGRSSNQSINIEVSTPPHPNDTNGPVLRIQDSSNPHLVYVFDPTSSSNEIIPVEEIQNPLSSQFSNQSINIKVSAPTHPNDTNGVPSSNQIVVSSNSYNERNPLALNSNINDESFYPPSEAPLQNNELYVNNNNDPVVEIPEKKSEINIYLEAYQDILNNQEDANFGRSDQVSRPSTNQGMEERPPDINNESFLSFPNLEWVEAERRIDLNQDLMKFYDNHCGSP